jgi:glycosyltransferase involved in cell wall biosynthesis
MRASFIWWVESTLRDRRPERRATHRVKQRLVADADEVLVPGAAADAYVRSLGAREERVFIAPNAVDNAFFAKRTKDRNGREGLVRFLFAGRLEPSKGLLYLLDAWSRVAADAELTIAGSGSLSGAIARRTAATSAPPIRIVGHLDRDRLAYEYHRADAFVLPSVSDPWGLVINEAMSAGLPVITTSAPGAVDDLVADGENGFVVPPGDPAPITRSVELLACDPVLRRTMGAASADRIRAFTPETWASGVHDAVAYLRAATAAA